MEKSECLRLKWRDEFGDAPLPSAIAGRDDLSSLSTSKLQAVLQVTSVRLSQLSQEIRQHEFIRDFLQNVIRERQKKEKGERDDKFINEYVYSFVGKDKRCSKSPVPNDPDFLEQRCDGKSVTCDNKQDNSRNRLVNGRAFLTGQHSLDRNLHGISDLSCSHSGADNSVNTKPPIPVTTSQTVTVVDYDSPDSDYGRVWIVPSRRKPELSKRYSTGMMSSSQVSNTSGKQPPPVPKKPNKPQPAPRLSLGPTRSKSPDLSPEGVVLSEASSKCSSLPRNAALNSNTMASSIDNTPAESSGEANVTASSVTSGCAKSLTSKQACGLEYTNSKSDTAKRESDRLSTEHSTGEAEKGVRDLIAATVQSAVNINNSLAQIACKEVESKDSQSVEADMKKLYRTKSDRKKLNMGDELLQGTYRKLVDEDEVKMMSIKTDDDVVVDVPMRPHKDSQRLLSDISTSSSDSTGTITDRESEICVSNHRAPSYENWTIDRCLTRHDDSNDSDESEATYDNIVFGDVSPASTLQKYSYKGSQDSGLADDSSTNESSPSVSDCVSVTTEESANENACHHVMKEATSDDDDDGDNEDCVDVLDSSEGEDRNDNVSVASDFEYMRELPAQEEDQVGDGSHDQSHDSQPQGSGEQVPEVKRVTIKSRHSSGEEESSFEEAETPHELSARDKLLQMRQLIVKGILESEKSYLHILDLLINYRKSLEASSRSSQPVISEEDTNTIFYNIEKLYKIHEQFVKDLEPKVMQSSPDQEIGQCFKMMVFHFPEFGKYMENYQKAVSTIHKCSQENPRFEDIAEKVTFSSQAKEVTNLEDALFKPVQRVQRNALVLHDLIKYTPEDHVDHKVLLKARDLSQYNLEQISDTIKTSGALPQEKRHLVKSSFLVELMSGQRKVRYVFLFSDFLICTKKESGRKGSSYDVKWYIPLSELSIDTHFDYQDDLKPSQKENIEEMKSKIGQLKSDLRKEMKKEGCRETKAWSISGMASARTVEKLKKKIQEQEALMILHMPKLPVKLTSSKKDSKVHTLLMTTDYEREEWLETMQSLINKCGQMNLSMTLYEAQVLINSCKDLPQVNRIASVLIQKDEEMCNGTLNVTIHKLNGLAKACDSYCCVEMDSCNHFFMKARTNICYASADPSWDQDFELELDCTQTLRVLVYEKVDDQSDRLLGRGALELSKSWLKPNFQEKTISMNDVSLVISVRHTPANRTMRRTPSQQKSAVFGVKISTCARRENKTVPSIVTACIQEVEKRGIDETGIYRVSGVTSEIQRLKKGFDKNVRIGTHMVTDCDIHAVTGMLKLYFRELPEPLFTEAQYTNFVESLKLSDKEAQEKCMLAFLHDLPDANYYTIVTLLEHLVRVAKSVKENKMTIYNLATVFGPTLLAPAAKDTGMAPLEMMSKTTEQVMQQSAIVNYFLSLAAQGRSLRKSAQC